MNLWQKMRRPPWRTVVAGVLVLLGLWLCYWLWLPGRDIRDGRHDRGRNGIWVSHGWLGDNDWFLANRKTNERVRYRSPAAARELADRLRRHHVLYVFPHLCPSGLDGRLPGTDPEQVERFLDALEGFQVIPWIGGPYGGNARIQNAQWRLAFTKNVQSFLAAHPQLAGVQINIEPLTSGDTNFLTLLNELRAVLPAGKILSVAAYPPPTRWHPYEDVHWDENYFREVARRSDQLAVMMYDAGQRIPKAYQKLMADWTQEVLGWSEGKAILLGVPAYDDAGVGYHDPKVENLTNALLGVHRGLSRRPVPTNFLGVAIYCDWEMSEAEWEYFRQRFLTNSLDL